MEESLSKYRMAIAVMLGRVAGVTPEGLTEECLVKGPFPEGQIVLAEPRTYRDTPRAQPPRDSASALGPEQREKFLPPGEALNPERCTEAQGGSGAWPYP